jgi:hypothetical protein
MNDNVKPTRPAPLPRMEVIVDGKVFYRGANRKALLVYESVRAMNPNVSVHLQPFVSDGFALSVRV